MAFSPKSIGSTNAAQAEPTGTAAGHMETVSEDESISDDDCSEAGMNLADDLKNRHKSLNHEMYPQPQHRHSQHHLERREYDSFRDAYQRGYQLNDAVIRSFSSGHEEQQKTYGLPQKQQDVSCRLSCRLSFMF